jgi:hypothetical protein
MERNFVTNDKQKKTNVSILDSNNGQNKRIALKGDMTK